MRKGKNLLMLCIASLALSVSCSNEKECIKPNNQSSEGTRIGTCSLNTGQKNLVIEPVGPEITKYLNCLVENEEVCEFTLPQTATYGPIDIYPNVPFNFNNTWEGSYNDAAAVTAAQQIAQDGLNQISFPVRATSAFIAYYKVVDNKLTSTPWRFELNVEVTYGFCTTSNPGDNLEPIDLDSN